MKSLILSILCFGAVVINVTSDDTEDLIQIKHLLRIGVNLDRLDSIYNLGLFAAAAKGQSNVVKFLIDNGANINERYHGSPILYIASYNGHDHVVDILIKHGAKVNLTIHDGWTPLNMAASRGYLRIVELLLTAKADINFPNDDGETPLYSAAKEGREDVVYLLLEKGANFSKREKNGLSPLHKAVEGGFVDIIASLRRKGADVYLKDRNNESPYDIAVKQGNKTIIDTLVLPKNKPWKKLHKVARNGNVKEIKELLANGVDVNILDPGERTPLFVAAANGKFDAVKVLLENGANINLKNKYGRAPIFDATYDDHYDVVKILIDHGAEINIRKYDGWTPLNMAAKKGYLQMVELFLKKGASVNIQTHSGETPLYLAAMAGHKDVVQLLIQRGANVNLKEDDGGWSPLHRAVENDFEEIVEILVANKADAYSQNKYNATPWSIAHNKGNKKIIELLKKAPRISEIVCRSFGEIATPRIFGGEGTEDGEFPAMAALGYFDRQVLVYKCGGSIISDQFVLTAAHCIYPSKPRVVRLGKAKIFDDINDPTTAVIRNIKTIIIHPGYNLTTKWNDIALIRVFDKIPFNDFVWPACLHTNFGDVPSSQNLTVTGWGISDPKRYTTMSKLLRKANLKSMPLEECRTRLMLNHWQDAALQSGFIEGQYCAYGAGVTDACRGDSGGPLQYLKTSTSVIVGIVSVGDYCGLDSPGIYTRVTSYLDWIESYVWSNLYTPN